MTRLALALCLFTLGTATPGLAQVYRAELFPSAGVHAETDSITVTPISSGGRSYKPVFWGVLVGVISTASIGALGYGYCKGMEGPGDDDCLGRWALFGATSISAGALIGLVLSGDPIEQPE